MTDTIAGKPHRELQQRLKRGYKLEQTRAGHLRITNGNGSVVTASNGRVLRVPLTPGRGEFSKRLWLELEQAGVLREQEKPKRKANATTIKRGESARAMIAERDRLRQEEVDALQKRLLAVLEPVGGINQPGMRSDVTTIAGMIARDQESPLTPDLLGHSWDQIVSGHWVTPRHTDIWDDLIVRLEEAESIPELFFSLLRLAKGLPEDVVAEPHQLTFQDGDWPFRVDLIDLGRLFVDHDYQRPAPWPFVRKLATSFDATLVGTLDVSERARGASFAIMDGQCRFEAMRRVGQRTAYCAVYSGLDKAAEAGFFLKKNRDRKAVHPYWTFRAKVTSGDQKAIELERTVSRNGYKIGMTSAGGKHDDRNISAISALEAVDKLGYLEPTLKALRGGFGLDQGQNAGLIRGLGRFYVGNPDARVERLAEVIGKRGPRWFMLKSREMSAGTSGVTLATARVLTEEYNRGLPRAEKLRVP